MAGAVRTSRSRGAVCGVLLILLGSWGGLIPFVGPYFGYGYTPDQTWLYNQGRLYYSVVPGAVAVVAGLIIVISRNRVVGGLLATLAAVAGAWFIAGTVIMAMLHSSFSVTAISPGAPISTTVTGADLDSIGMFAGAGALIVFVAAVALGRFSLAAAKDIAEYEPYEADLAENAYSTVPGATAQPYSSINVQYPGRAPFPPAADPYQGQNPASYPGPETYSGSSSFLAADPSQTQTAPRAFPAEQDPSAPSGS